MAERVAELLGELSQESTGLLRQELRLIAADLTAQGRRVGGSAALLGGAGVLGVGAFGALTAGLIALLGRRPARGALIVAALYGAGAGALADAAVKRLGKVAPEAAKTLRRDLKAAVPAQPPVKKSKPRAKRSPSRRRATE
jgi:Putative Actinobacterial Holin-X, holin superfamily III